MSSGFTRCRGGPTHPPGRADASATRLRPWQRAVVGLLRRVHYGRIENLFVVDGEPTFEPAPRLTRNVKFGPHARNDSPTGADAAGLKSQVTDLFDALAGVRNGRVTRIEVANGLPLSMEFVYGADAADNGEVGP